MVILQITDDAVRVLRGSWPNISAGAERPLSSGGNVAEDIRQIFSQEKLSSGSCILLLSRREVVFQEATFPSSDHAEILKMIALRVSTIIPYDKDQILYDYRLLRVTEVGFSDVVIAAVPDAVVQKYITAAQEAGLTIADVYLGSENIDMFLQKKGPDDFGRQGYSACVLVGTHSSEVVLYVKKQWLFSYCIPYGDSDLMAHGQEASQDVLRCIESFEKKHGGAAVHQVWIMADDAVEGFTTSLATLRDWMVSDVDFRRFLPDPVKVFCDVKKMGVSWIPLLGCLMKDSSIRLMSFLPKGIFLSKVQQKGRSEIMRFLLACLMAGFLAFFLFWSILQKQAQYVMALEDRVAQLDPRIKKIQTEAEFLERISRQSDKENLTVHTIKEIYQLLPADVFVQSLEMRLKGGLSLQGIALKDQSVNELQAALVSAAFFNRVELQYATKRRRFDKEYTEFKIVFYLSHES